MIDPLRPMLHTLDLPSTIAFYTGRLGFALDATWSPTDGGPPTWCALSHGAALLMFTIGDEEPALTGRIYCYPADVDTYHDEIVARGASILHPPRDTEYGMREFSLEDPNGYLVSFGRALEH